MASAAVSCAICKAKFFAGSKACLWRLEMGNRVQLGGKSLPSPHDDAGKGGSLPWTGGRSAIRTAPSWPPGRMQYVKLSGLVDIYLPAGVFVLWDAIFYSMDLEF